MDNQTLILELIDKANMPPSNRPKKPVKEEPKVPINYLVRNHQND